MYRTMCLILVFGVLMGVTVSCSKTEVKSAPPPADPSKVTPPATPGSAKALEGTSWQWDENTTLTFTENGTGLAQKGSMPPMSLGYQLRENGVISVIVGESTQVGTWDDEKLVLGGRELRRVR